MDSSPQTPTLTALLSQGSSSERNPPLTLPAKRKRQIAKIREVGDALAAAGLGTLDKQAEALALSRSTTWNLLKAKHKSSGLSATLINRMLAAPRLPPVVRTKILEYVTEKVSGRYGDTKTRLGKFATRLSGIALDHAWAAGAERRKRSMFFTPGGRHGDPEKLALPTSDRPQGSSYESSPQPERNRSKRAPRP